MRAYSVKLGLFFAVFAANEFERRKVTAEFEYFDVVFVRRICFLFFLHQLLTLDSLLKEIKEQRNQSPRLFLTGVEFDVGYNLTN